MENKKPLSGLFNKIDNAFDDLVDSTIKGFGGIAGLSIYAASKKAAEDMNKTKKKIKLTADTKRRFEAFFHDIEWDKVEVVEQANLPANLFKDNIAGMTYGHTIYTTHKESQTEYFAMHNLIHELVHVTQIESMGEAEFAKQYGQQFVTSGGYGEKMPLEGEAYGFVRNIPFEPFFYMGANPDVNDIAKGNKQIAFLHWLDYGIDQGKQGCKHFSPALYLAKNPDVEKLCGKGNYKKAIRHWLKKGIKEGRKGI
jgi:hypothetical protein